MHNYNFLGMVLEPENDTYSEKEVCLIQLLIIYCT